MFWRKKAVVFVSGYQARPDPGGSTDDPTGYIYLQKPIAPQELVTALAQAVAASRIRR